MCETETRHAGEAVLPAQIARMLLDRPKEAAWVSTAKVMTVLLALAVAWTFGAISGAVARTEATLAEVEQLREGWREKEAKAQQLLQQLEAIQREQAPAARPNRMTPNAGQVSSL